ncbi:LacI family DNA-binding transcriptional regulator [Olivibacter domesticus]|uniref:Transcriptional regulator, LacI family n=1 Tax=Olivibacter domesticus TaxID=407022 RepID=A0A1H7TH06_OLID1|nr:LacI family DNA-binding transcriptional regulator [Olivibacter domesticus]SEL83993.1 transcriptional regulator, LacI family [Olivibacter domesticus]
MKIDKNENTEKSIVDIAKALGVSAATVSRALNDNPRISEATRKRVKEKAIELGYRHNSMASSLRNKKSKIIGLIVPRISMYFHAVFITALQNRLQNEGYSLMVCQSNDSVAVEQKLANTLYSSRVDALVVSLALYTENYAHFDGFINRGIPLIFYDRVPTKDYPAHIIQGDDYRGGVIAGNHLIEMGCSKIAYISGPLSCSIYRERTEGLKHVLKKAKVTLAKKWCFYQELTAENAWNSLRQIFAGDEVPEAIFASNDTTAVAAVEFAREQGIKIPQELKIIGYSNDPRASIISPPITTIDQHPDEMAHRVAYKLLHLLKDKNAREHAETNRKEIVPVTMVRRMTT